MSIAEKLIEELKQRDDLRETLAEELLPVLVKNRRLRFLIATSILREVATKEDIKDVENRLMQEIRGVEDKLGKEIDGLRKEINELSQRVSRLEGMMSLFIKLFVAFNLPILLGVIGILLKMVFASP